MFGTTTTLLALALIGLAPIDDDRFGHSRHGSAFDSGMRTKPWTMAGVGTAPFTISTKSKEVQAWYDQGNALLHSFWFEEAERSFRWCHKLEPENAMVYFGLARCGLMWFSVGAGESDDLKRYREFLKQAMKRRHTVSERERLYIEAWDAAWSKSGDEARHEINRRLQQLCVKYPDDIEAKTQLAFFNIGEGSALANDFLIQQVLAVNPMHPGAHHARIHNWDGIDSAQAIASCEVYGKAAPGIGHSLHMPGHIYTKVGMWHEAAIAMDSATRVELAYMNQRLALPFETWNYAHNRDYLCYIQEQLGMAMASIQGAKDMHEAPRDPAMGGGYPAFIPLVRALLKFEKWDAILDGKTLFQAEPFLAQTKAAAEIIALAATKRVADAREKYDAFKAENSKKAAENGGKVPEIEALMRVAEAKLCLAEGNRLDGIRKLLDIAEEERVQREKRAYADDPPSQPWPVIRLVGDAYWDGRDYQSALDAYIQALQLEVNDAWALAGVAKCYAAMGNKEEARRYAGRFLAVWSGCDPGLRWSEDIRALNLGAKPVAETLRAEAKYDPKALDALGPSNWQPFSAPDLSCLDTEGKPVTLADYRGKNVLLVFYLTDQCVHCMEQLGKINARLAEFGAADTVVLAASSAKPEANKASVALSPFKVTLLSDTDHANARRFASYDDFEGIELHSTILIDKAGRVRWKRTGGEPFTDVDFLLTEIKRWPK